MTFFARFHGIRGVFSSESGSSSVWHSVCTVVGGTGSSLHHDDSIEGNDAMRLITTTFAFLLAAISVLVATPASASHNWPLYRAASEYREAVGHFERAVLRAPCFDLRDERIVDLLDDASIQLRIAARHPEYRHQLHSVWDQIQSLEGLVADTIFGHPRCPAGGELVAAWDQVIHAGSDFAAQLALVQCVVPRFGVPRLPIFCVPNYRQHEPVYQQPVSPSAAQTPLPYWHPSRSRYAQGLGVKETPRTPRTITAHTPVPRDTSDVRKTVPSPRTSRGADIERTSHFPTQRIISAPSQGRSESKAIGAKLMRR